MKQISDDVVALTAKYGGLLWGGHGKGFRAEYNLAFFGEELLAELRRVKAAFDLHSRFNPGKIYLPEGLDTPMMKVDAVKRGTSDRQILIAVRQQWRDVMECNGNGLCFNFDARSPICLLMKTTQSRIHSPKRRVALVREWLRLLADRDVDPLKLEREPSESGVSLRTLIARTRNSWHANKGGYDFSHEAKEAMSGCPACKAYSTQCPIKINVPKFRSRSLQLYHICYLCPLRDHLVATVESYAPLMARAPKTFNPFINQPPVRKSSKKYIGMVDLPLLSVPPLQQQMVGHRSANMTLERLEALNAEQKVRTVSVVQDPLTSYYDAQVVADFARLVERLSFQPVLLPFLPNNKAQHIKGFLNRFAKTVKKTADLLNRMAKPEMPMVGVDPALVLCYRDEYKLALGEERGELNVLPVNEWLASALESQPVATASGESWYFFGYCIEVTVLPGALAQQAVISTCSGAKLENVSVGRRGMAGTYGHEAKNHKNSLGIYELSWHQAMQ